LYAPLVVIMNRPDQSFLRAVQISKRYGGVEALSAVNLDVFPGEVIGVIGDTDAGKTTLLGLISGILKPDSGQFYVRGRRVRLSPLHRATRYGIRVVHQDINLAEHMSALSYIFAGQALPTSRSLLRWIGWWNGQKLQERAAQEFIRLGFDPPPLDCPLNDLTSAQRKMVAFVHATIWFPCLLLLDEPINALEAYKANIFRLIRETRDRGGSVLLVTQNLDDIFKIADRILVLNAGQKIAERQTGHATVEEVVSLILGSVEDKLTPAVWALSNYFEVRRQAEELDRLNKTLERRAIQLQAHAEVAQSVTSILDRDELLTQIVQIIQQRFGYYHTGIFLVDSEAGYAVPYSSVPQGELASESGGVPINEDSLVGWCALHGECRLANDVLKDALFKPESNLPDTWSELVLPLRIGKRVLGVLDLRSNHADAFGADDVVVMQSLADQLAIAIRNADLFDAAEAARAQADKANRLKSVFLSNMSHELRTPLSAIIGLAQAMMDSNLKIYRTPLPEECQRDLQTISKSGGHLLSLINDILDLSKIEAGQIKLNQAAIDLKGVLNEALFTTQALLHGRPVELLSDFPADLPPVWADSVYMRQVVLNLLSNAAKFTEQGRIKVSAMAAEREVVVCVADTGIGIPEHVRQNIFDRFHRGDVSTSRKYGGTGLGLSISRQLIELQGGRIWVESEVGTGSRFYFTVPLATLPQRAQSANLSPDTPLYGSQRSVIFDSPCEEPNPSTPRLVLLSQADTPAAAALHQAFERDGYVIEFMAVDKTLIEMAEAMLPDLIVLDATGSQGAGVLHALLEAPDLDRIPIIVMIQPNTKSEMRTGSPRKVPVVCVAKNDATPSTILQMARTCLQNTPL
jgi:signal transduction histidine kinase/ABC-type branched-subunit amino acid transport system ATPase component